MWSTVSASKVQFNLCSQSYDDTLNYLGMLKVKDPMKDEGPITIESNLKVRILGTFFTSNSNEFLTLKSSEMCAYFRLSAY